LAKKSKKKIVRREYSKADVRELRAHSKARTPVDKIAKLTKRTVGSLRQKALKLGIGHRSSALTETRIIFTQGVARNSAIDWKRCGSTPRH